MSSSFEFALQERDVNTMNLAMKKTGTEESVNKFKLDTTENYTAGSTDITTPSEFSVATDDINMEDLETVKPNTTKVFEENEELAPLSKELNKLEDQLYQYLFTNMTVEEQSHIDKFVLVPIGLPGMGKSTLSRFLSATS